MYEQGLVSQLNIYSAAVMWQDRKGRSFDLIIEQGPRYAELIVTQVSK